MDALLLILASLLLVYCLLARRIEAVGLSAPMLFTLAGAITGPLLLDWLTAPLTSETLAAMAEITLAVILFVDASQVKRDQLMRYETLPIRLLLIGLPLTMLAGALLAVPLLGLPWLAAAWLAIMLSPTDAALAQPIFSDTRIAEPLRQSITVESGLNDGLALPILLFVLALMNAGDYAWQDSTEWPLFALQQFGFGILAGVLVGRVGGSLVDRASRHHWMSPMSQRLSALALSLLAYSGAEIIGGNGFIAAFMAGLLLHARHTRVIQRLKEFGSAEGELLSLLVFFLFGLIFVAEAWPLMHWSHLVYALLSLTLVRMIPVLMALTGTGLAWRDKLFLAWFGPRGIASILYLLLAIQQLGYRERIPNYDTILATTVLTVLLSILLHGLSTHVWPASRQSDQSS